MATIASLSVRLAADIQAFTNSLNTAVRQANKAAGEIEKQFKGLSNLGKTFASIGTDMAKAFTLPAVALAGFAVTARAEMQKLEMGLDAITGSSAETAKQLARLKEIAKLPGLSLQDAVKATINLQSVGVESQRAERFIKGFGNALALVGKGAADLNPVITQLVQMSTKSKVVAGDLRPIMDAVPQVAGIIKDFYGTIDTEKLQKMGVSTQEFTDVVLKGLERLPKAGQGIGNSFENLKDSLSNTFAEIGKSLEGPATLILDKLSSIVDGIQDAAMAFQTLPAPAKAAIGALVATAASIGPVLLGLGQLMQIGPALAATLTRVGAIFGVGAGAVLGWAAAVAVAVAGLAALGTWIYQNWKPITVTLTTAFDALKEMWGAAWKLAKDVVEKQINGIKLLLSATWGPVIKALSYAFDLVAPIWRAAWDVLTKVVTVAVTAVRDHFVFMFDSLKTTFNAFVSWAKSHVPGAAKLFSLGDVWEAEQKKLAAQTGASTSTPKATRSMGKFAGGSGDGDATKDALSLLGVSKAASLTELQKALAIVRTEWVKGNVSAEQYASAIKKVQESAFSAANPVFQLGFESTKLGLENAKLLQPLKDAEAAMKKQGGSVVTVNQVMAQSAPIFDLIKDRILRVAEGASRAAAAIKGLELTKATITGLLKPFNELGDRIEKIGVVTSGQLSTQYDAAQKALADAKATNKQLGVEYYTRLDLLKLQFETLKAKEKSIGLTKDEQAQLISINGTLEKANKSVLDDLKKQKKPMEEISTILTNMSQKIADSIVNWKSLGDVATSILKEIGNAIISNIIQHFLTSTKLISKITDGLSSILSKIPGLGGIFGAGASTATTAASTAANSASTAATGAASVVKGVTSSLTSVIGAVGSVGSMISGIIGNFQNARQENTLNAIEESTRYVKIWTGEQSQNLLWCAQKSTEYLGYAVGALDNIGIQLSQGISVQPMSGSVAGAGGNGLTINIYGGNYGTGGASALANDLGRELRLRGLI